MTIGFHRYSEMSGALSYRLRGIRPMNQRFTDFMDSFSLCFLEEQERKGFIKGGEAPHEPRVLQPKGLQIFLGPCFLEEQERKDSFSQNNHLKIVIQNVLQLMNQRFTDSLFIVLILFLFVF